MEEAAEDLTITRGPEGNIIAIRGSGFSIERDVPGGRWRLQAGGKTFNFWAAYAFDIFCSEAPSVEKLHPATQAETPTPG